MKRMRLNTYIFVPRCQRNLIAHTLGTYNTACVFIAVVGGWAHGALSIINPFSSLIQSDSHSQILLISPLRLFAR